MHRFEIVQAEPMTVQMYICMYKTDCVSCLIESSNSLGFFYFVLLSIRCSFDQHYHAPTFTHTLSRFL